MYSVQVWEKVWCGDGFVPSSCRFVWLSLWFLALDQDSDDEVSSVGTMMPSEEGAEDDNVSTSTHEQSEICMCLCSKRHFQCRLRELAPT